MAPHVMRGQSQRQGNLRARLLVLEGLKLDSLDIHYGYVSETSFILEGEQE